MKIKLIFILAIFFLYNGIAQTIPTGENISLDQQLSLVNQSSVTSGIIYERTLQIANLYNFNKRTNFNQANYLYFKQVLLEMNKASNGTKFTTVNGLKSLIFSTINNEVDLGILNTQFNILNYNVDNPSTGGLTFNLTTQKFSQINGKQPFYMMHNTVIAPLKDFATGDFITFKLRNDLFFTNGTKTIKTLVANFGDGVNRTIINNSILTNQNITINYNSTGVKIITFTITYNDNTSLVTYGKIFFRKSNSNLRTSTDCGDTDVLKQDFHMEADLTFTGYNSDDPKIKAQIDYRVYYANGNTEKKIRKPIIIIDGFDPGDKRKISDCDCELDSECAAKNTNESGVFDPEKHKAMLDLMIYYDGSEKKQLLSKLRETGFDVIIVNHPKYKATNLLNGQIVDIDGGAYYIESNAMALIKLINTINQQLSINGSTNQIAIIAPSMAGQISKYALSYMEKNNITHNTYLWISIDSPHLGANIPMGDQALINLVRGESTEAEDFYYKELSSPAAQQLLIEFHREKIENINILGNNVLFNNYHQVDQNLLNAQTTLQGFPTNRGNTMFQQHFNNQFTNGLPNSKGWPQNTRKIAIINGSLTGSKKAQAINGQPIMSFANNNEKILNIRGYQRVNIDLPWPLGSITWRTHIASLEAQNMPSYGNTGTIARFKKSFNDRTTVSPNINPRGVIDNSPGGYFDAQLQLLNSSTSTGPVPGTPNFNIDHLSFENLGKWISNRIGGDEWYLNEYNPIHSFIPTFSALGHLQPNQNWSNPVNTNLTCPSNKLTPFDSYFGLANNTQHTSFTKESVEWLFKELAKIPQAPYFPIQENLLNGANTVCLNTNTSYSFADICKLPSTVTNWSVSSNLQVVSSTGTSVIVKGITNGQGSITAIFQNGQKVEKTLWIGKALPNYTAERVEFCNFNYRAKDFPGTNSYSNYSWQYVSGTGGASASNFYTNGDFAQFTACPPFTITIKIIATNPCGTTEQFVDLWLNNEDEEISRVSSPKNLYTIYPNPSKDLVTVELIDQNLLPQKSTNIYGELFDLMGISKSKVKIKDNKAVFSVNGLNKGIYVLKIFINDNIENHQIAVE